MKYGFMAMAMPLVLDKTVYIFLQDYGIEVTSLLKKKIRKEYREIVERTPALDKGNSLTSTLYIGCYLVAFHKAAPDVIDEKCFEGLIECLCDEMMHREKENDSAFSEKNIKSREEAAKRSQTSVCEMDWKSTFRRIDKDNYEFTYSKCGLCELGKREGCFYLIKYLCMTDYISFDKGGAKLIRNHTLANGDEYCDFHVSRKEK
ncbi:MAG: L-2-amino-thiazoline-4-carboxylic acid hydrolase [Lachnospiraceae bacterium]|nr:L-2-amino-thiazoline-4-carboxylic acid hydrolase [Lachnospiraceae bacterium]